MLKSTAPDAAAAPAGAAFALPAATALPVERVFVLKLACTAPGQALQGRVEHVLSGRRQDFATPEELVQALAAGLASGLAV